MANETSDSVKDRFAQRFENENSNQEQKSKTDQTDQSSKKEKTANIKQAWANHSFYMPEQLASELSTSYKILDLELDQEQNLSIQKTRHYYPLIVKLGLDRLDELDSEEVKEELEQLELK